MTQVNYPKRSTIGFLSANIHVGASRVLWPGILDAAVAENANLICFHGGPLHLDESAIVLRNVIHQLVDSGQLEGLVTRAGLIGNATPQEISDFAQAYRTIPQVDLGVSIEGCPVVKIDGKRGMRALLVHLIETHGYQQIALIGGPENHPGAQERYHTFLETLHEKGLKPDKRLILHALSWNSGFEAMSVLLDERGLQPGRDFEAVVAVSDLLAIGAIERLAERGFHVPTDVAVTGFNNTEEGRLVNPPLTSVPLPLYEQGWQSVETLLALLAGEPVPEVTVLPSRLLVRQSCGCLAWSEKLARAPITIVSHPHQPQQILKQAQELLETEISQVIRNKGVAATWAKQLLDAFCSEINSDGNDRFRATLTGMLQQGVLDADETSVWQNTISILRNNLLPTLTESQRNQAEALFGQARVVIGNAVQYAQNSRKLQVDQQNSILRDIGLALITTFDVDKLTDLLATRLPELGIRSAYLALYDNSVDPLTASRLIMAYSDNERVMLGVNGRSYPSGQLLPPDLLPNRRHTLLVETLSFQKEPLGIMAFEVGPQDGNVYEVLRRHISTALKGAILLKKNRDYAKILESEVSNRTEKLLIANQQLINYANELEKTNQELQEFTYISSHDLQEPLRKIRIFGDRLQSRVADKLDKKSLQYIEKMISSADRMQTLISALLQYSKVNSGTNQFAVLALSEVVKSVLEDYEDVIHELGAEVSVQDLPTIEADKTQMWQLFQNLIGNALKFRKKGTKPVVTIFGGADSELAGYCQITVSDNGVGFNSDYEERIFQAFRRLHSTDTFEGTGIGLAICRKVVQRHNGYISARSSENEGATFIITLPYKQ